MQELFMTKHQKQITLYFKKFIPKRQEKKNPSMLKIKNVSLFYEKY